MNFKWYEVCRFDTVTFIDGNAKIYLSGFIFEMNWRIISLEVDIIYYLIHWPLIAFRYTRWPHIRTHTFTHTYTHRHTPANTYTHTHHTHSQTVLFQNATILKQKYAIISRFEFRYTIITLRIFRIDNPLRANYQWQIWIRFCISLYRSFAFGL